MGVAGLHGADCSLLDVLRSIEVWFTESEVKDLDPLGFQRLGLGSGSNAGPLTLFPARSGSKALKWQAQPRMG